MDLLKTFPKLKYFLTFLSTLLIWLIAIDTKTEEYKKSILLVPCKTIDKLPPHTKIYKNLEAGPFAFWTKKLEIFEKKI